MNNQSEIDWVGLLRIAIKWVDNSEVNMPPVSWDMTTLTPEVDGDWLEAGGVGFSCLGGVGVR